MNSTLVKTSLLLLALAALPACSGQVIPQDATNPSTAAAVSLEMKRQEVKTYDCNNNLTSDQVEVVDAPTLFMQLFPLRSNWTYSNITNSSFTDVQTGSDHPMIVDKVGFTVDHGDGLLSLVVNTGINEIKYQYTFDDGLVENGSRFINVNYKETLLPGFSTAVDCPPPTPTPTPGN